MRILYLKNSPLDNVQPFFLWAQQYGVSVNCIDIHDAIDWPAHDSYNLLVVGDGPMHVCEANIYPWILSEKNFIAEAVAQNKAILAICFGAQLVAEQLGSRVTKKDVRSLGWNQAKKTPALLTLNPFFRLPQFFDVYEHSNAIIELPKNAVHLAQINGNENAAFIVNQKQICIQFHLNNKPSCTKSNFESVPSKLHNSTTFSSSNSVDIETAFSRLMESIKQMVRTEESRLWKNY